MQIFRIHRDSNFKRHHVCSGNFLYQFRLPLGGILVLRLHLVSLLFTHCSTTVYILFIGSIFLSPLTEAMELVFLAPSTPTTVSQ